MNSETCYEKQWKRSFYFTAPDGTRLAADLILPSHDGKTAAPGKFPAILIASRGGRFDPEKGNGDVFAAHLIPHGYAASVLELRGCGASFGTCESFADELDRKDVAAFIDWLGAQPWCTGRVGMVGISNRAFIQLAAATERPKCLAAITPTVAITDFYYQNYPNGVSAMPHLPHRAAPAKLTKEEFLKKVRPVDDDPDGTLAYQAFEEDQYGKNRFFVGTLLYENMNRDTENPHYGGEKTNLTVPPLTRRKELASSGIRQHQFIGQLESGALGQLANFYDMGGSFTLGPWTHFQSRTGNPDVPEGMPDFDYWYRSYMDAALKGEDNGFFDAPPATYYVFHAKPGERWRCSDVWPPENVRRTTLYLSPAASGTVASVHDGTLTQKRPDEEAGISYPVDTSISVFDNHDGKGSTYNRMVMCWDGDMTEDVDRKGLTFTSAPLFPVYENVMAGCVSVDLWVTSTAPDGDFIATFEEVLADGTSHFIKDGVIRASHRTPGKNTAWEAMGATWHTSMTEDVDRCLALGMNEPVQLKFAIEPIAYQFRKGSRLRLTITCADTHTYQHPMYEEGSLPTVRLYTGGDHASSIQVPFIEHEDNVYNGWVQTNDGQTLPGTLYFFEKNIYLYAGGRWKKFAADSPKASWTVHGPDARFDAAGFTFRLQGKPAKDGILQSCGEIQPRIGTTAGEEAPRPQPVPEETIQPLPAFRHRTVDTVPIEAREEMLFVPDVKILKLDVFKSDPDGKNLPCVINIHGYGGSFSAFLPLKQVLGNLYRDGYAVAGIDLRNYPSNLFPDYIHDVKGAIRLLRAHADEFGIDPNRIGCLGLSLGGNSALMAAVSGEEAELEGTVGGNLSVSSRLQAVVAGFAWTDLLTMGKDICDEYAHDPALQAVKFAHTDGEQAPCAEVIGFAGSGRGMKALRDYAENAAEGSDPDFDDALSRAKTASPLYHITPSAPPTALFAGLGMDSVDIAFAQTLRTFRRLQECGVPAFLFANTLGEYGRKREIVAGIKEFLRHYLKERPAAARVVALSSRPELLIVNEVSESAASRAEIRDGKRFWNPAFLSDTFGLGLSGEDWLEEDNLSEILDVQKWSREGMTVLRQKE